MRTLKKASSILNQEFFRLAKVVFCWSLLLSPLGVQAQSASQREAQKKKTSVNFEDQLIQGELNKPDFFYFLQKKQFNFGRLIKLRENFLLEMKKTSEEVERRGGS
ncbi:MAG: hypothetical protein AB7F59_10250 [Bdellovibrionales bacterium]